MVRFGKGRDLESSHVRRALVLERFYTRTALPPRRLQSFTIGCAPFYILSLRCYVSTDFRSRIGRGWVVCFGIPYGVSRCFGRDFFYRGAAICTQARFSSFLLSPIYSLLCLLPSFRDRSKKERISISRPSRLGTKTYETSRYTRLKQGRYKMQTIGPVHSPFLPSSSRPPIQILLGTSTSTSAS